MYFLSTIKIALKAISANKLRSFLTMLGIIIGIASVIILVSIGQGAVNEVKDRITKLGINLVIIRSLSPNILTIEDSNAIENECDLVNYASPQIPIELQLVYKNQNYKANCYGVSKNYDKIRNWEVSEGHFFTEEDLNNCNQVCVIGYDIVEELFNGEYPIDQFIRIKHIPFRVVGVFQPNNFNDSIFVPYTAYISRLDGNRFINIILVSISSEEYIEEAIDEMKTFLMQRHHLTGEAEKKYLIISSKDGIKVLTESKERLTLFLVIIASISLLVGGIGIMNIMLVSVTERIREIGIRMSLGARGSDILRQFLFESMTLSIMGGIIGIVSGIIISLTIPKFFPDLKTFISIESIIISFIFSAGIGIFFGFYPAWEASKLTPIDALRNESDNQISLIKLLQAYKQSGKSISLGLLLKLVLQTIFTDKMKEFLAILGVIIAVASVITMISIGQGASKSIQDSISLMGKDLIEIHPVVKMVNGVRQGLFKTLKVEDSNAIANECPFVTHSSPLIVTSLQAVYGNKNCETEVYGVLENYYEIKNWEISDGDFFTEDDIVNGNKVCVIGDEILKKLFNGDDPIGQFIRLNKIPFRVVGVLKPKGNMIANGRNEIFDDIIFIPYTVARSRIKRIKFLNAIACSINSDVDSKEAVEDIKLLLRQRHKLQENDKDDFEIITQTSIQEAYEKTSNLFTLLLSSIAFISLLVGGIGIMNIMLVSVTARTKEIGIRMSVGARRIDIVKQFLFESVRLSMVGGIIGIIFGIVISQYVPHFFPDLTTIISIEAIIISFLFSVGVGIFFGFYPAWQASKLDPIEALRYE